MFMGIVTAVIFLLLAAKFVTKRLPVPGPDRVFLKIHKLTGALLPVAAGVHAAKMFRSERRNPVAMYVLGVIMLLGVAMLMFSHFFTKMLGPIWLKLHRAATLVTGLCLAGHAAVGMRIRRWAE